MFLSSSDVRLLVSPLREVVDFVVKEGFDVIQTYRHPALQRVFFKQGRFSLQVVNREREKLGLKPLKEFENVVITKTEKSRHCICLAFDVRYAGQNHKENRHVLEYYTEVARKVIARFHWINAGALWASFRDYGHYELSLDHYTHYRFMPEHKRILDEFFQMSESVQSLEDALNLCSLVEKFFEDFKA